MFEFCINNGRTIQMSQANPDGPVTVTIANDGTEYTIQPGEMVMLLNYYRACKNGFEKSDFIAADERN